MTRMLVEAMPKISRVLLYGGNDEAQPQRQQILGAGGFGNGVLTTSDMLASTTLPVKDMLPILMD